METHETINSIILTAIGIGMFFQDRNVKFMKAAMEAYDPAKLKAAQDIILAGKDYEHKLLVGQKIREINETTQKKWTENSQEFLGRYGELLNVAFSGLLKKSPAEREEIYATLPKNAQGLRDLIAHYDKGDIPSHGDGKSAS
jgi:hypothetical protein